MSTDHYLKMLEQVADNLSVALEHDELDRMEEDELLSLLNGLQAFNRRVDAIVGNNPDDFDVEQSELLLSEMESFFSENEEEGDSVLTKFDNLGKSLQVGELDENQYKN